jgi:hypothetical protein
MKKRNYRGGGMRNSFVMLIAVGVLGIASLPNKIDATIIYVPDGGLMLGDTLDESVSLEFGGYSETLTFRTWSGDGDELWWAWWGERLAVQAVDVLGNSPARLEVGMEISESSVWGIPGRVAWALANPTGEGSFYDATGFIGVRVFEDELGWDLPNALPYYGWIRVEHDASESTLTVHDWAWNSVQGEPILAGAIPEPRVYALAFGVGVFGFVLVRRRRGKRNLE